MLKPWWWGEGGAAVTVVNWADQKRKSQRGKAYFKKFCKFCSPFLFTSLELVWLRGYTNLPKQSYITAPVQK